MGTLATAGSPASSSCTLSRTPDATARCSALLPCAVKRRGGGAVSWALLLPEKGWLLACRDGAEARRVASRCGKPASAARCSAVYPAWWRQMYSGIPHKGGDG